MRRSGVRILAVSDLHYSLPQFDWLVKQAQDYDAIVIAGDLLDISAHLDLDSQILVVCKYLDRIGSERPLLVASGNHDGDDKTAGGEYVARWLRPGLGKHVAVDGDHVDFPELRISICAWWDGPESRSKMDARLAASRPEPGRDWLWIHHAPPIDSPVAWTGKKDAGDEHVRKLIRDLRPSAVITGHIHNAPFHGQGGWADHVEDTWVFNAGRQIGPVPTHLVLDWTSGIVTYFSLEGTETLQIRPVLSA